MPVGIHSREAERARVPRSLLIEEPLEPDGARPLGGGSRPGRGGGRDPYLGQTSAPRPVELTYGNFLWSALGSAVALDLDLRERWLCALPVAHVGGLSTPRASAIYGTTAVVHERFETDRAMGALMDGGVTLVSLVATTLSRLLDAGLARHRPVAPRAGGRARPASSSRASVVATNETSVAPPASRAPIARSVSKRSCTIAVVA